MQSNLSYNVLPPAVRCTTVNESTNNISHFPSVPPTMIPATYNLQSMLDGLSALVVTDNCTNKKSTGISGNSNNTLNVKLSDSNNLLNYNGVNNINSSNIKPFIYSSSLPSTDGAPFELITSPSVIPTEMQNCQTVMLKQLDHEYIVPNVNENLVASMHHNQSNKVNNLGSNIYVASLPEMFTDAQLLALFAPFGSILSAKVMCHKGSNRCKGYGFVLFEREDDAARAQSAMIGHVVGGNKIQVRRARISASTSLTSPSVRPEHTQNRCGNSNTHENAHSVNINNTVTTTATNNNNNKNSNLISPLSLSTNTNITNTITATPTPMFYAYNSELNLPQFQNELIAPLINARSSISPESEYANLSRDNHSSSNSETNIANLYNNRNSNCNDKNNINTSESSTENVPQTFIVSSNSQASSCTYSPYILNNDRFMFSSLTSDGFITQQLPTQLENVSCVGGNINSTANIVQPINAVPLYLSAHQFESALANTDSIMNVNNVNVNNNTPQLVYMMVPITSSSLSNLATCESTMVMTPQLNENLKYNYEYFLRGKIKEEQFER